MAMRKRTVVINAAGGRGAASGSGVISVPSPGILRGVSIEYNPSAPATTSMELRDGNAAGTLMVSIPNISANFTQTPVGMTNKTATWGQGTVGAGQIIYYEQTLYVAVSATDPLKAVATVTVVVDT